MTAMRIEWEALQCGSHAKTGLYLARLKQTLGRRYNKQRNENNNFEIPTVEP